MKTRLQKDLYGVALLITALEDNCIEDYTVLYNESFPYLTKYIAYYPNLKVMESKNGRYIKEEKTGETMEYKVFEDCVYTHVYNLI